MIYLPSSFGRWWICPKLGVDRPPRFYKRIGWSNDDIRQTTLTEYLEINEYQFLRAMTALIPLEARVLDVLSRRSWKQADIERLVNPFWQDIVPSQNCSIATALKRLMKQGKITRKLHSQGWFKWYVYSIVKGDKNA